jgi:RIO kinase 1
LDEEEVYSVLDKRIKLERTERDADDKKTYDEVFDKNTLLSLGKLISKGVITTLDFPIATGKEGNVYRATGENQDLLAVKIYRTSTSTYKNLMKYITGDPRFRNIPKDRRGIISLWAQKEYKNLKRMEAAEIPAPRPVKLLSNILVMTYIGCGEQPAPMIKDCSLERPQESFEFLYNAMKKLFSKAQLVHGDLSEYNILVEGDDCFLIDVGQSVVLEHPLARELLQRDVDNLARYFRKLGVSCSEKDMLKCITEGDS